MIAINKELPVRRWPEFAEWVNKQPERVRCASSGIGNQPHLWGELFKARNKLNMEVVGYKGSADALRDVMGGHVPAVCDVVLPTGTPVKAGRLTAIVVAPPEPSPLPPHSPPAIPLA